MDDYPRQSAADSHSGLRRQRNEDCYAAEPGLGLWLVADGVGGHACGEVASGIVCSTICECIAAGDTLPDAVAASHRAVLEAAGRRAEARGMGSTVVAVLLDGDDYELCWVGDSRAYLWDGELRRLTADHNRAGELLASEIITPEQANSHPERHILTRALGVSDTAPLEPGHVTGSLQAGQQLMLCSDGLTDEVPESLIAYLLAGHESPRAQVDALLSAALEAGGSDNITVVVIGGRDSQPATAQSDPEVPHNTRRSASGGRPNDGRFPFKALALVSAVALLVAWLLT